VVEAVSTGVATPLLEARAVTKSYGRVSALSGANFTAHAGEVVALMGDNGAGKSTLVKCMSGVIQPDSGDIFVDGGIADLRDPHRARLLGLETVFQDLALAADLDAAANLFMGRERLKRGVLGRLGFLDRKGMADEAARSFASLGVGIQDSTVPVVSLSGGQRQSVAVARAVVWASKIVVMDEPTAALGMVQTNRVQELIEAVRTAGRTVILVSHDLPFVLRVADRIEILRLGRRVAQMRTSETDAAAVLGAMTGAHAQEGV
jgi:simple sugar transport system ATP-binding protein